MTAGGRLQRYERAWWRRPRLLIPAVALPLLEAALLLAVGVHSGIGLAPQVTAVGPFGVFHDLRWLLVFHDSFATFALGMSALVAFRTLTGAALVAAAWPETVSRPAAGALARNALVATVAALVFLTPWTVLLFAAGVVPLSWAFYAAVPPLLATVYLLNHSPVVGDWWRRLPPLRSAAWILTSFLALSLASAAIDRAGTAAAVGAVAAAGLFNAWAWHGIVAAAVTGRRSRLRLRWVPVTPLVAVGLLAVAVGGAGAGFALAPESSSGTHPGAESGDAALPVLLVSGFAGDCCDEGASLNRLGLTVEQFSYRGLDAEGRPVPHSGAFTDRDLVVLAGLMQRQVEQLQDQTGRPVTIVAESEGTLVARLYLAQEPAAPVARLVLLSPIERPGRVTYPEEGEEGPGVVAGYQLRAVTELIEALAPFEVDPDGPLARSLLDNAAALAQPLPKTVDQAVIVPLADAVTLTPPEAADDLVVVPAFHGGLRGRADVQEMISEWVRGGDLPDSTAWLAAGRLIAAGASAWHVPALDDMRG